MSGTMADGDAPTRGAHTGRRTTTRTTKRTKRNRDGQTGTSLLRSLAPLACPRATRLDSARLDSTRPTANPRDGDSLLLRYCLALPRRAHATRRTRCLAHARSGTRGGAHHHRRAAPRCTTRTFSRGTATVRLCRFPRAREAVRILRLRLKLLENPAG